MDRYREAAQCFESVRKEALASHIDDLAARAVGDIGSTQFALHQYQPALRSYLEAKRLATAAHDATSASLFEVNIASLYSEMGALDTATQWFQAASERLSGDTRREVMPKLLLQTAVLRVRQDRMPEALRMFGQSIDAASRAGDVELAALSWNRAGEEFLKRGELAAAEPALLEAYRIRKLNRLPLESSYRNLGRLRLEQGNLVAASALLDRAVELAARPQGPIPSWDVYHYRGRVRLAQGRLREAMSDLRIAVRMARDWRWSIPPDDASRIGAEGWLEQVHSALVEAGNRLYLQTGEAALVRETFEAAEENRAASLRALLSNRKHPAGSDLPPQYWEALKRLQRAEVDALRSNDPQAEETLSAARAQLARLETGNDPVTAPLPTGLLAKAQAAMDGDSALLTFHLGNTVSWMWALDNQCLTLYPLPARKQIEQQVSAAADAIRGDSADASRISANLYRTLFGSLATRFQHKSRWLLALDQGMFDAPIAALTDEAKPTNVAEPTYLAEHHVIEFIPGVGYWVDAHARSVVRSNRLFVGVGDPIYNTADPRRSRMNSPNPWFSRLIGRVAAGESLALPRLVASGAELAACARAWSGERTLLQGSGASRGRLLEQLRRDPAVVHFATHFVESQDRPVSAMIALSLNGNEMELLQPAEIAHWSTHAGLVVLSGCSSAAGAVLPGTGVMGLTRAWLLAGAQAVVSSHWDTPDESGALFRSLYSNLNANLSNRGGDPAKALRNAQLEMIRSGDWRARPRYWGAYSVVGNL